MSCFDKKFAGFTSTAGDAAMAGQKLGRWLPLRWLQGAEVWPGPGCFKFEDLYSNTALGPHCSAHDDTIQSLMKIAQVFVDVATSHPVDRVLKVAIAVPTQARPLGPRADGWLLKCLAEEHGCLCLSGLQTHSAVHGVWQLQGRHSFQKPPENQAVGKIQWLDRLDVKWKPKHHCGGFGGDGPSSLGLVLMSLVGGSLGHHTLRNHGDYMAASDLRVVQVGPSVQERLWGGEFLTSSTICCRFWCCIVVSRHESKWFFRRLLAKTSG